MSQSAGELGNECETFVRLLSGSRPNAYLIGKYVTAHTKSKEFECVPGFDTRLVNIAARSPLLARLADAYSRRVSPRSTLRRKLVLTLALIEVTPPFHQGVTVTRAQSLPITVIRLGFTGLAGIIALIASLPVFGLVHAFSRASEPRQ